MESVKILNLDTRCKNTGRVYVLDIPEQQKVWLIENPIQQSLLNLVTKEAKNYCRMWPKILLSHIGRLHSSESSLAHGTQSKFLRIIIFFFGKASKHGKTHIMLMTEYNMPKLHHI